ncbi:ATP-dependent DNA helicase RecG [Jeotgalibacillus soli]|uniref:ATP-dependent DNA helicase RecG n=1 Tax=Jeotgalibacillus soli TaxID=889306 RepID=A0A0C2RSW6_9BACL|nr:ATP-dependent DNA helicase RecG [Jeotgalibacillus soli]KIL44849.1 ATP-dependent DNA helicase [Jeotgalibacillus soli]
MDSRLINKANPLKETVQLLKGVGEETVQQLEAMGIVLIEDLINYLPYRYDDFRLKDLSEAAHEERVTIEGRVHSEPALQFFGKKKSRLTVRLLAGPHAVKVTFFNQPYLKKQLNLNDIITVTGKWDRHRQIVTAQTYKLGPQQGVEEFTPVYPLKGSMTNRTLQKMIKQALQLCKGIIIDPLPEELIVQYRLMNRQAALEAMHFPSNPEDMKQARRRFVYEEFFYFQLKMQALRKFEREQSKGISIKYNKDDVTGFIKRLPFPLTKAQQRVMDEIFTDMLSPNRMNRLLQGDVGSGKTVVAAIALYGAITAGYQGALMVPTEILAEQHAESLNELFAPIGITVALLTSSVKGKKRTLLLEKLKAGEINIMIGTHALIQDEVDFQQLGLVITDEQHRFGVNQRRVLREKGENPDVLFMTATPIPRTLAITVFGEMDVSIIDEMPAGRKPIETYWAKENMLDRILAFMEKELVAGRQAYVICPLIEESDKLDVQNAIDVHMQLEQYFSGRFSVGLMHGRLHSDDKEAVMKQFSENKHQVLVSTTVVEVGVNVPNASLMVIYDAERFGLSQLHQLRGRVGRGSDQSYCILLAEPKNEVGKERMKIMTETNDGFVLSEKDLELRGPGDFFGRKQSGLPEFRVADMVHDYRALEVARDDAHKLIERLEFWNDARFEPLRSYLMEEGILSGGKLD